MSDDIVEFCRRLRPRLIGSLSLLLGDDAAAEDAAQEALARTWDRWERVREMGNPEGWTYRVLLDDLSVAETAEVMGCAAGTVKSLTHRALAALRADPDFQLERSADGA